MTRLTVKSRLDRRHDKNIQALHALLSIIVFLEFLVVAPGVVVGLCKLQIEMGLRSQTLGQQVQDTSKQVQEQVQTKAPAAIAYMCCQQEAVHSQSQCQGFCVVCLLASCLSISAGSCSSARTS